MKHDYSDRYIMKKITDDHLGELKTFQDRVVRKLEGKNSERRDQMKDFDYNKLVAS